MARNVAVDDQAADALRAFAAQLTISERRRVTQTEALGALIRYGIDKPPPSWAAYLAPSDQ